MIRKKLIRYSILFISLLFLIQIGDRLFIFSQLDKTLESSYYLEFTKQKQEAPPPVYLVSYADKHSVFFKNQNAQALSAINNGIDHIMMFKRSHIDQSFYQKNKKILDTPQGAGLWIWKPYIMLKAMENAPENSIIIYADSPVIFKKPITPFIERLEKHDILLLLDGTPRKGNVPRAGKIIPKQFIEYFKLNHNDFMKMDHLWSCFVAVRNNQRGRAFVKQWLINCERGHLSTPLYDQSMLVIAAHQRPEGIYVMDTDEAMRVIKNVHRHPDEEFKSLLPDIVSKWIKWFKFSEWGYNARWIQWLRSMQS